MSFTVGTLNCNGLRAAERRGLGAWLTKVRPDVLCIQELRAWPDQVPAAMRCPEGYNTRWVSAARKGYSGVGVYSRAPMDRAVVGSGLDWSDAEGRVLRVELGELVVVSVYVPSGSAGRQDEKFQFLDHFAGWCAGLLAEGRPTLLCGDINIAHAEVDIHAPGANKKNSGFLPEERAWFTGLLGQGWVDVFRQHHPGERLYSWWSSRGQARALDRGWRIDYVLASPGLARSAESSWIDREADLADHAPVLHRFAGALYDPDTGSPGYRAG